MFFLCKILVLPVPNVVGGGKKQERGVRFSTFFMIKNAQGDALTYSAIMIQNKDNPDGQLTIRRNSTYDVGAA